MKLSLLRWRICLAGDRWADNGSPLFLMKVRSLKLHFLALFTLWGVGDGSLAQTTENGIAAVVNGTVITKSEVREAVKAQEQVFQFQMRDDPIALQKALAELSEGAVDSLIDRELILTEFKKIGGTIKAQYVEDDINSIVRENFKGDRGAFVTELAKTGMTLKKFRALREKMIIVQVMRGRYASEQAPPTPLEVRDYYEKNIDRYRDKDMIKISTITVPKFTGDGSSTEATQLKLAKDLRAKVVGGSNFKETAKTYSQDSRSEDGGEWPWMERTQMKKSIADAAFAVKEGGISDVVEDEAAFIVIAVDAKKLGTPEPLEKVRAQIERMIRTEKSKAALDGWLENLRRKANIKRYDKAS
jgi:peptidyl-prolyl cis-trans isomerase SurA